MYTIDEILGKDGLLSRHLEKFAPRQQQIDMAHTISDCLRGELRDDGNETTRAVVVEAGTGTGKTFAYLVPVILSGMKIIISTGTKNLQEQIFQRDLPTVRESLGIPMRAMMLKGRANYACLYRMEHVAPYQLKFDKAFERDLATVKSWTGHTRSGDIAELTDIKEDAGIWPYVTSTVDNCLGQDCPSFSDCFLFKQRREAQKADVLVVNHHLFFADMALKDDGYGELLPGASAVVFDEAHQIPGIASRFFSKNLSSHRFSGLVNDVLTEQKENAHDQIELADAADDMKAALTKLVAATEKLPQQRAAWELLIRNRNVKACLAKLSDRLAELEQQLEIAAPRSKGLEACWHRCESIAEQLALHLSDSPDDYVHWYETFRRGFSFSLTPLQMSGVFRSYMEANKQSWIFTSATLSVGESFDYFISELGINNVFSEKFESPFDFKKQALMYLPQGMPEPNSRNYTDAVIESLLPVIRASQGRAFLLFTSYAALNQASEYLAARLDYPVLVQGSMPKSELLARFTRTDNAVLIATSSFWEGVDVRGDALSCVVIDKLPFASPGDPILQARLDSLRREGRNPFMDYQLPQAVISLKQGFGRLIRDVTDTGVIMICDPRLTTKSYGKVFLQSLPKINITRDIGDVEDFFRLENNPTLDTADYPS